MCLNSTEVWNFRGQTFYKASSYIVFLGLESSRFALKLFSTFGSQKNTTVLVQLHPVCIRKSSFSYYKQSNNINKYEHTTPTNTITFTALKQLFSCKNVLSLNLVAICPCVAIAMKYFTRAKPRETSTGKGHAHLYDSTSFRRVCIFVRIRRHKRAQKLPTHHRPLPQQL